MPSGIYKRIKSSHRKGKKMSEESKLKMRLFRLGKPRFGDPKNWKHTPETKEKLKQKLESFMKTKGVSLETRKKLSIANMGHLVSKEVREKISKGNKGRKMSIDFRNKCRQNNLGKKQSPETIEKRVLRNIGLKRTIESKNKISIANKGKKRSLEVRKRMSEFKLKNPSRYWLNKHRPHMTGEKNSNWKGGKTPENIKIRGSLELLLWKKACMKRDSWTCQKTGQQGGNLVVHHINNFSDFPELRTSIENGITLSKESHQEFHKKYGFKNNSRKQLEEYLGRKIT